MPFKFNAIIGLDTVNVKLALIDIDQFLDSTEVLLILVVVGPPVLFPTWD